MSLQKCLSLQATDSSSVIELYSKVSKPKPEQASLNDSLVSHPL